MHAPTCPLRPLLSLAALLAAAVLLLSCGGSRERESTAELHARITRLHSDEDVLHLPLLRSGERWYEKVRLKLADDGGFQLLGGTQVAAPASGVFALLEPALALEQLGAAEAAALTVPRLHLDAGVFSDVRIRIAGGQWRFAADPQPAASLDSTDLQANPALHARAGQLLMLTGRSEDIPLQLEDRTYRYCLDEGETGVQLAILDPQGATVLALDEGGECANLDALPGTYRLRKTTAPGDAAPPLFMQPPLLGAGNAQIPGEEDDYWMIEGILEDRYNPGILRGRPAYLTGDNEAGCSYFVTASAPGTVSDNRPRRMFDLYNFFRLTRDPATGRPVALGPPPGCTHVSGPVGPSTDYRTGFYLAPRAIEGWQLPLLEGYTSFNRVFYLTMRLSDSTEPRPVGRELRERFPYAEFYLAPANGTLRGRFQAKYRMRERGLRPEQDLEKGQVALFSTPDCSGRALILQDYNLHQLGAGTAGSFNVAARMGPSTELRVYPLANYLGSPQSVSARGCTALPATVGSVRVHENDVDMVLSSRRCEGCNLAGLDFSRRNLQGAKLAGAILNNANLEGAMLRQADLRNAFLQGSRLVFANLDRANLCGAQLNADAASGATGASAADLTGAFLRNANLARSNLTGANFTSASFYSSDARVCDPGSCEAYREPSCASAVQASAEGATFNTAYLAGVDFASVRARGANFSGAILVGANFHSAQLEPLNLKATVFSNAFLQGADFTAAQIAGAGFTNAYGADTAGCMQFELDKQYTSFTGFTAPDANRTCREVVAQNACVQFAHGQRTLLPPGTLSTPTVPLADARPRNGSTCQGQALCGGGFTGSRLNICW